MRPALYLLAAGALALSAPSAQAARSPEPRAGATIRAWLADRLGEDFHASGYVLGWADLTGDGRPEAFAYMSDMCGSGGCNMYVLQLRGDRVRMLGRHTITRLPIAVLDTRTHGLRDFSVGACGGGIHPCYRAWMRFDGWKYLSNPSLAAALPPGRREHVVIPALTATP
jgi:hypothetical protein